MLYGIFMCTAAAAIFSTQVIKAACRCMWIHIYVSAHVHVHLKIYT